MRDDPLAREKGTSRSRDVNKMLGHRNDGLLFDSMLDVRVMAIDANFYKGMRDRLYRDFRTGASAILCEMGIGYGELMGKKISEQGAGKLSVYGNFIQRGKLMGWGSFETRMFQMIVSGLRGRTCRQAQAELPRLGHGEHRPDGVPALRWNNRRRGEGGAEEGIRLRGGEVRFERRLRMLLQAEGPGRRLRHPLSSRAFDPAPSPRHPSRLNFW